LWEEKMSSLGVLEGRGRPRVEGVELRREEMVEAKAREEDEMSPTLEILALRWLEREAGVDGAMVL
jgi:hypothetical protein